MAHNKEIEDTNLVYLGCNMSFKLLKCENSQGVATVTLNRPEIHNAFNDEVIEEVTTV